MWTVGKFCYLGDMLSVDGDADAPISPSKKPESEVRLIRRGGCIAVVCDVVCYKRPGLSGKKMKRHFSEQR